MPLSPRVGRADGGGGDADHRAHLNKWRDHGFGHRINDAEPDHDLGVTQSQCSAELIDLDQRKVR